MMALPVGLAIYLCRKFGMGWRLIGIGAATFVLSQAGHLPFNAGLTLLFQQKILPSPPQSWAHGFNAAVLGLSAGLWEELSRYAVYRWWAKDARQWRQGVLMGVGHGGMEALLLGALVLMTFFQMVILRNLNLSAVVPADQLQLAQEQVARYWSAPWYASLLGAFERAFTIPLQILFSVLILQVFVRRNHTWLWLAVGLHAFIDASAVLANQAWGAYATELLIGLFSAAGIYWLLALSRQEPPPPQLEERLPAPPAPTLTMAEESRESLERTKYTGGS